MADVFTRQKRSEVMSRIRGKGNLGTELVLLSLLREHRISGWRRHLPLPGRPDFAFPRQRVAIFVDGCFWHSCPRCRTTPATNREFWKAKFAANAARDRLVRRQLLDGGWTVIRIWEHSLARPAASIRRIKTALD